jgi:hypothetical protein
MWLSTPRNRSRISGCRPGIRLEKLTGDRAGQKEGDVEDVEIVDHH